jgi:hypothetical protein
MRLSFKWGLAIGLGALLLPGECPAFPPAPDNVIYGLVRDEWGDPILTTNAVVILETASGVTLSAAIIPLLGDGINYRLTVPMDAGITADLYKPTALRATVPFRIKVRAGQTTSLPIQMQGDYVQLGQPAQKTRLDLTLGEDSVGDGLPDAWRRMILAMSNGIYTNINQIHADDRFPGNPHTFRECYIAGTYPWDASDGFALAIIDNQQSVSVLQFAAIQGRTYTVVGSPDLKQWNPVAFRIASDTHTNALMSSYSTNTYQYIRIEVPPQNGITNLFFRGITQ